jgi:hypothetical protein
MSSLAAATQADGYYLHREYYESGAYLSQSKNDWYKKKQQQQHQQQPSTAAKQQKQQQQQLGAAGRGFKYGPCIRKQQVREWDADDDVQGLSTNGTTTTTELHAQKKDGISNLQRKLQKKNFPWKQN